MCGHFWMLTAHLPHLSSVRISRELQDVRRGAFIDAVAKYLQTFYLQYTGWQDGTSACLYKSSYIESNGESLTLDCCNDLNESTSGYLVASHWVDNYFGICLLTVSTNHWFREFEGILHHICYSIICIYNIYIWTIYIYVYIHTLKTIYHTYIYGHRPPQDLHFVGDRYIYI